MDRTIESVIGKFNFIFSKEEMNRITFKEGENDTLIVVDVHGMKCCNAERFVRNIIAIVRTAFKLLVIHGYHYGTAIRDMLRTGFKDSRVLSVDPDANNDGRTLLVCGA